MRRRKVKSEATWSEKAMQVFTAVLPCQNMLMPIRLMPTSTTAYSKLPCPLRSCLSRKRSPSAPVKNRQFHGENKLFTQKIPPLYKGGIFYSEIGLIRGSYIGSNKSLREKRPRS